MFITVTRVGGSCTLRVAAAAVAYLGDMADGARLHLQSGEYIHVTQPIAEIEQAIRDALTPEIVACEAVSAEPFPSLALIESQLSAIVAALVANGLGGHASLRDVVDEALQDLPGPDRTATDAAALAPEKTGPAPGRKTGRRRGPRA